MLFVLLYSLTVLRVTIRNDAIIRVLQPIPGHRRLYVSWKFTLSSSCKRLSDLVYWITSPGCTC